MADEVKAEPTIPAVEGEAEKQTNRVFTQSDFDKMVAKKEKELSDKYQPFVTKAEELEKASKQAELDKLSEVEKLSLAKTDLEKRLAEIEADRNALKKMTMKLSILSDAKYSILPEPYRKVIDGETDEEVKLSADKALKDLEDFLKRTGTKANVGIPPVPHVPDGSNDKKINPITEGINRILAHNGIKI